MNLQEMHNYNEQKALKIFYAFFREAFIYK